MSRVTRPNSRPIRILCVDDHAIVLAGLVALLDTEPDMSVVGSATTARQGIEEFRRLRPDVALIDLGLPDMSGVDAIAAIRRESPDARLIVLTMAESDGDVQRALDAGASGYLLKTMLQRELLDGIRSVDDSRPSTIAARAGEYRSPDGLTSRELDVLRCVADGGRNADIAAQLGIKEETVKAHLRTILTKLNARSRAHAVTIAIKHGFIAT
jgi:DNA-binding NarL/FixJ family response regulator